MQFSYRFNLASHILLYLAEYQDRQKVTSEVLSSTTGVNAVNVRKTLCLLKAAKLIETRPGIGGTYLTRKPEEISLADIFDAVEDPDMEIFPMHPHPNEKCPVGRAIRSVMDSRIHVLENSMHHEMEQMTLKDLQNDMHRQAGIENGQNKKEKKNMENIERVCEFLKNAGTYYLATVDGDQSVWNSSYL